MRAMFASFRLKWRASISKVLFMRNPFLFGSIPVTAAAVGYITNYLGVHMLFYPIEWTGVDVKRWENEPLGLFGWQGVVPAKREIMASSMVDVTLSRLLSIKEVFAQLNPAAMADILTESISKVIYGGYVPSGVVKYYLNLVSKEVIQSIEQLISCRDIMIHGFTHNPDTLGAFFRKVGHKELKFLVDSGTYFGFLLGILQMLQWMMFPLNWTLPVGGAVVGFITNWIALKLIFEPVEKKEILGGVFTLQGMFLTRQKEVSAECSKYLAGNVLTSHEIWKNILLGEKSKDFEKIIMANVPFLTKSMVDAIMITLKEQLLSSSSSSNSSSSSSSGGIASPIMEAGPEEINNSIHVASKQHPLHDYINHACRIEHLLIQRMELLTPHEFERVIHPVFEEDELTLIAAGGVLGAFAGYIQWWVNIFLERRRDRLAALLLAKDLADPPPQALRNGIGVGFQYAKPAGDVNTTSRYFSTICRRFCTVLSRGRVKFRFR